MPKFIKIFLEIFSWLFIIFFAGLIIFTTVSNTNMSGGFRSYLVQSGSMEPSIMTGDIIVINRQKQYFNNDVITFKDSQERVITHRIVDINQDKISTKGDANRTSDPETINQNMVLGKVIVVISKLGYVVSFTKTLPGVILLIVIPCLILMGDEIIKVIKNLTNKKSVKQEN